MTDLHQRAMTMLAQVVAELPTPSAGQRWTHEFITTLATEVGLRMREHDPDLHRYLLITGVAPLVREFRTQSTHASSLTA